MLPTAIYIRPALLSSIALLALIAPQQSKAQFNTNHQLAFPTTSVPSMDPPNGLTTDAGWADGFDFRMEDGTPWPTATMRGVATTDNLHLAFTAQDQTCDENIDPVNCQLEDLPLFSREDVIVVAFNVGGLYHRLHIMPCFNNMVGVDKNECPIPAMPGAILNQPAKIEYWTSTTGAVGSWGMPKPLPAGLVAHTSWQIATSMTGSVPSKGTWQTELQIPRSAFPFIVGGDFGFFVDLIVTDRGTADLATLGAVATQYTWPTTQQIGSADITDIAANVDSTLAPNKWGVATLNPAGLGSGLKLVGYGSNQPDQSQLDWGTTPADRNELHATMTSSAAETGVQATFKMGNYGISTPDAWALFPVTDTTTGTNPTDTPSVGISLDPREYRTRYSGGWVLDAAQSAYYQTHPHQCVEVTLSHTSGPPIVQAKNYFNMNFAAINSPFENMASLNLVRSKEIGKIQRVVLTEEFRNMDEKIGWKSEFRGVERLRSAPNTWYLDNPGEKSRELRMAVQADDSLKMPVKDVAFSPQTGLRPVTISVRPGQVISLIVNGNMNTKGREFSPLGTIEKDQRDQRFTGPGVIADARRLAREPYPEGALIASFDNLKTSFMVGRSATILVPRTARKLTFRLAGKPSDEMMKAYGGYSISVIASAVTPYMKANYPVLAGKKVGTNYLLPFGVNLPTYIVRGSVENGTYIRVGDMVLRSRMPLGSFGSYITRVNQGPVPQVGLKNATIEIN